MTYKYIVLVLKSEKQHDAALQDLQNQGLEPTMLSPYERISGATEQTMIGYSTVDNFCSNGTLSAIQLSDPTVCVLYSRKEFIQEVKKYLV